MAEEKYSILTRGWRYSLRSCESMRGLLVTVRLHTKLRLYVNEKILHELKI